MLQNVAYTGAVTLACPRTPRAHEQALNSARRTAGRRAAPRWALDPFGEFDERGRKIFTFRNHEDPPTHKQAAATHAVRFRAMDARDAVARCGNGLAALASGYAQTC
jgi:hypothetical protein